MNKYFTEMKIFDPQELMKIAALHVARFKKRVTKDAEDYKGKKFKPYSESYKKLLEKDYKKKDGSRYKGYRGYSLTTGGEKIAKRPLVLRGLTMRNFGPRKADNDSYTIGWTGNPALIVDGQAENGRNIIDDIPDNEWDYIVGLLGKGIDKEWSRVKNVSIKVG